MQDEVNIKEFKCFGTWLGPQFDSEVGAMQNLVGPTKLICMSGAVSQGSLALFFSLTVTHLLCGHICIPDLFI